MNLPQNYATLHTLRKSSTILAQLEHQQDLLPFLGGNNKVIWVVFWKIYAAIQEFYATAGRSGRAKYQLWPFPKYGLQHIFRIDVKDLKLHNSGYGGNRQ